MRHLVLVGLLLTLMACDDAGPAADTGTSLPPESDRVPITSRAIAAIALDHLPADTERREPMSPVDHDPRAAGARLGYGGEQDDVSLDVLVSPRVDEEPCPQPYDGCEELKADDGSPMFLRWQELEPEEDPGVVDVVLDRGDERVRIELHGQEEILGDPREMDLSVWVDQALEIAQDPRLRLRTSQEAVDAGERLDRWDEDEGNPAGSDVVPARDRDLAAAYLLNQRDPGEVNRAEPSPLKKDFGAGAIGARLHGDGVLDIVAAKEGPSWLTGDLCESRRFRYCDTSWPFAELTGDARRKVVHNSVYILWRPGPSGEIWVVQQRVDQVVALRWSGLRVPHRAMEVHRVIDLVRQGGIVANSVLGLTTLEIVADSDVVVGKWQEVS
ncbi:hypothetical protein [Nocardioides speluncae]|uniref:hypothetical protein n=1 Tax=Nocardioides speluncae TaxID=2670337 RepID=UPI000D68582B|nr:hypothetical protein [Nocardioides speluncae]